MEEEGGGVGKRKGFRGNGRGAREDDGDGHDLNHLHPRLRMSQWSLLSRF